jgi:hypothetical protein
MARDLLVDYLEDDGMAARWFATTNLLFRHPWRCAVDLLNRSPDAPPLHSLAPAVRRLERDSAARIHTLGASRDRAIAERLARLAGRTMDR